MKVLLINCVYKKGSTGKIVYDIYNGLLQDGYECTVCYGRGLNVDEKNVYKCCWELYAKLNNLFSRFTGVMYGGCLLSTLNLFHIILKEKPDIVHVHCINGYFVNIYRLITFLKKHNIKTVLTLHAEFMYTANCSYSLECVRWMEGCGKCPRLKQETKSLFLDNTALSWKKMKKAFEGFDRNLVVASVSPWLQERARYSPILIGKKHVTVYNGLDTSVFCLSEKNDSLRCDFGLANKKIVFHATSGFLTDKNHIKGGYYVVEMAKRFLATDKDVVFVIAGSYDNLSDIPPNVILLGKVTDQKNLAKWYSTADVTLITSKKETFSMIVAESLCCGTPVVGFEAGAPEMITIPEFSDFISYGNSDKLFDMLKTYLYFKTFDRKNVSTQAQMKYGKKKMVNQYQMIYKEMMNK